MNLLIVILVVTLIVNSTNGKGHSTCNDDCLTKTYCLSSDGSNVCSKNNLVTAKWFVIQQKQSDDIIVITLNGQGIKSTDEKMISHTFQSPSSSKTSSKAKTVYSCYKSPLGATSAQVVTSYPETSKLIQKGSSFYSNDELLCTWTFTKYESIYPLFYSTSPDLVTDSNNQLLLQYGAETTGTIVATDTTGLPIYHLQFLNCCYKVHGNKNYLFVTNQTTDNQYLVQAFETSSGEISIFLKADKIQLMFICDFKNGIVQGSIINGTTSKSFSDQIYGTYVSGSRCTWSHPLALVSSYGRYDTTNGVYDLQIKADNVVVYSEKGVKLRNSASKLFSLTSIILLTISLFFNWSI